MRALRREIWCVFVVLVTVNMMQCVNGWLNARPCLLRGMKSPVVRESICGELGKSVSRSHSLSALFASKSIKDDVKFCCQSCGAESIKWMGRCPHCNEWNTIKEFRVPKAVASSLDPRTLAKARSSSMSASAAKGQWLPSMDGALNPLVSMSAILQRANASTTSGHELRMHSFSKELDRVLGGGLMKGSVTLLAGEPGIGKSTLLLQLVSSLAGQFGGAVYLSGEENAEQLAMRFQRLDLLNEEHVDLLCDVDIDAALDQIADRPAAPALLIVDSIQTMRTRECDGAIGSVSQIRDCTAKLVQFAKTARCAVLLVGHVTKSGEVAGPRVMEHMVDTVLTVSGSEHLDLRMATCEKNRFGSASEVGLFRMTEKGLIDVRHPSEMFLSREAVRDDQIGSAIAVLLEGSRAMLGEVQCLVSKGHSSGPSGSESTHSKINSRRASDGFPFQRLQLLCAVVEKRLRLSLWNKDVYLNVVGGLRMSEPAADLAAAMALVSSATNCALRAGTACIGEVGLSGELRSAGRRLEQRLRAAAQAGCQRAIIPAHVPRGNAEDEWSSTSSIASLQKAFPQMEIIPCRSLRDALQASMCDDRNVEDIISATKRSRKPVRTLGQAIGDDNDDDDNANY